MNATRLIALAATIAAAAGSAAFTHVYAQDGRDHLAQAATGQGEPGARGERGMRPGMRPYLQQRGPQLFTPEERAKFGEKMKAAQSAEERAALRQEMRMAFEQRAKEKGLTLGQRPGRPQLSREDHQRFQERWNNAKTAEEREALRKEMLATVDQRAKESSTTPPGPGRRDGGPMAQLFTPQERDQFRDRMKNAKDRDERRKIMGEIHAMVEARAKEKGIKLPERGRHEHRRGPMERGPRSDGATPGQQG